MFGIDSNPYGDLLNEDTEHGDQNEVNENSNFEILPEAHADSTQKEPSKDSVSYHLENKIEVLKTKAEEKIKNESLVNLVSFGVIGVVGFLILKRYL
jgi:hypothetical protein